MVNHLLDVNPLVRRHTEVLKGLVLNVAQAGDDELGNAEDFTRTTQPYTSRHTGVSKKVAPPLKLLGTFSLRLSLFA